MTRDVAEWLTELGLAEYADVFAEHAIDARALPALTEDDLKELGVKLGHRRVLLQALATLSPPPAAPVAPTTGEGPDPSTTAGAAERRQLTIVFCDLVGSTELSQKLDAEELREVNRAYQDACKTAIGRYEGFVARYMGDGVLAYFGYPRAHEDDAERAIHAALGVVASVAALHRTVGADRGIDLAVRVGIATGTVVVGDLIGEGTSRESPVVGETPNLAARLQALAAPNAVLIGPGTHALAAGRFEYEDLGHRTLKGIARPVRTWRVIAPSTAESRFEAAHRADLIPLVGREQEVGLLLERWEQAKEGEGQVVLLSGEAGIGKSRVIETLRERTAKDEPLRLRYQCSPYHTSSALHPFIDQLERAARFAPGDPHETRLDKLESLLAQGTRDVSTAAALVAPLLSIASGGRYAALEMAPDRQKEQTLDALLAQAEGLSRKQPVLFTFEDAHWTDPTSLELLEMTVVRAQRLRMLIVITFRPEFPPPSTGHTHVTSLTLNRFTRSLAAAMVGKLTGGKSLPDKVLEQIIEKTDGVPLFVEELTKTILESGLLVGESGGYALSGSLSGVTIPATLHDSLMARLDRLGTVKEIAQTASVIGREFDYDLLASVSPIGFAELHDALRQLMDAELVFRQGRSQESRYLFKHALVKDAAYEGLLKSKRRELHGRIADVLESRFPERAQREPELLARHLTEAGLLTRAAPYWRDAGKRSSRSSAYAEAIDHFTRGLAALGDVAGDTGHLRCTIELQVGLADSLAWAKGFAAPEVEAAYRRARELCRQAGEAPELFGILWGLWHFFDINGDLARARELAQELCDHTSTSGDSDHRSQAHRALGETLLWLGEFAASRAQTDLGIAVYDPAQVRRMPGAEDPAVANRVFNAVALWCLGYPDQALGKATEALELGEATIHAGDGAMGLTFMAWIHVLRQETEATRHWSEQLLGFSTERGMTFFEVFARIFRGSSLAAAGAGEEGARALAQHVESWRELGTGTLRAWFLGLLAQAHLQTDRPDEARVELAKAFEVVAEQNERWMLADLLRLEAETLLRLQDPAGAERSLARAIDVARAQQARSLELRACTSLARLWLGRGEPRQAHALLAPAYQWFTEGFDTPDLIRARALLAELS